MAVLVKKSKKVRVHSGYSMATGKNKRDYRLGILVVIFLIVAVLIVSRLFKLQLLDHSYYVAMASGQHEIFKQLYPTRGDILIEDKEGVLVKNGQQYYPIATNENMYLLYSVPKDVQDPESVLVALKEVFEIEEDTESTESTESTGSTEVSKEEKDMAKLQALAKGWEAKLVKENDPYEPLKHLVTEKQIDLIEQYELEGIFWTKETARFYSEDNIGSQLIGFVGKQAENNMLKGYYGIEGCYDKDLAGDPGFLRSELDTFGRWIATAGRDFRQAENGNSLVLTIDRSIQYFACKRLADYVEKYDAEGGSIIAMRPTGEILAMCNVPDFDPNKYNEVEDISVFVNRSITENYEPGSVFKPITMAAALDTGAVEPFTGYQDTGEVYISGYTIRNSDLKANGWQTMTQVLEKSLNTGTIFAARQVGMDEFKRYVEGFGFGKKTDIDLCQEGVGNIKSLDKGADIYLATGSFGQGLTVTPLQLVRAFAAIANDGQLVEPYVVKKILDVNGEVLSEKYPKIVSQIISPNTSKVLGGMLVSVVKNGHAGKAQIPGYLVAGKTGTAQVPDFEKGGYSDKTIHTFVGYAPYENPVFSMVVKLDNPTAVRFSSDSATPLFGEVGKFILDYYEVPPEVK